MRRIIVPGAPETSEPESSPVLLRRGRPRMLSIFRHGQSVYSWVKEKKKRLPEYQNFVARFREEREHPDFRENVQRRKFPSKDLLDLAIIADKAIRSLAPAMSDYETPLTELGHQQGEETGANLDAATGNDSVIGAPDVVLVSPYLRTRQTRKAIAKLWRGFRDATTHEEGRLREKGHGMQTVYNDEKLFLVFNPEQALLHEKEDPYSRPYLQGEDMFALRERAKYVLSRVVQEYPGKHVSLITHDLFILALRAELGGWTKDAFLRKYKTERPIHCGLTVYEDQTGKNGRPRLVLTHNNEKLYSCSSGEDIAAAA